MSRKPPALLLLLAGVLASALIAAGCGDDEEDTTTTATTTTEEAGTTGATGAAGADITDRASLIEAADAICASGDEEIDAAASEAFGNTQPPPAEQEAFVEETVIPNVQDQLDQLRELEPPAEDAEEFTAIIDEAQAALDELEADPSALGQGQDPFAEANRSAQEFGLEACGG